MRVEEQPSHEVGERRVPSRILPAITLSQLTASSVWFAGNAVMPDLIRANGLPAQSLGDVTTAVQAGFITGTLVFAILSIADRVSPRRVFLVCALLGAAANGAASITGASLPLLLASRFATGFCLAGIYPVGMRIAAAWYNRDLGRALGFLVGALVLATALPHLIRGLGQQLCARLGEFGLGHRHDDGRIRQCLERRQQLALFLGGGLEAGHGGQVCRHRPPPRPAGPAADSRLRRASPPGRGPGCRRSSR